MTSITKQVFPHRLFYPKTPAKVPAWELTLVDFLSSNHKFYTPFPKYFQIRFYELQILTGLLPEYFNIKHKYENILEIGCGFGFNTFLLKKYAKKVTGVDLPVKYDAFITEQNSTSVSTAKILAEKLKIPGITFEECWTSDLKLPNCSSDLIFSEYVLEHIPASEFMQSIKEMHRVLKDGGLMIHVVPSSTNELVEFVKLNSTSSLKSWFLNWINQVINPSTGRREKSKYNGIVIPQTHSEFLTEFSEQIEYNSMENYVFPMLQNGFKIENILSTREHNKVFVLRKNR